MDKMKIEHYVEEASKEVWVACTSAITAMSIPHLVNKYYPGYKTRICDQDYYNTLIRYGRYGT